MSTPDPFAWACGVAAAIGRLERETGSRGAVSSLRFRGGAVDVVLAGRSFELEATGDASDVVRAWAVRSEISSIVGLLHEGRRTTDENWALLLQDMGATPGGFEGWSLEPRMRCIERAADAWARVQLESRWGATEFLVSLVESSVHVGHDMAANLIDGNPGTVDWR